MNTKQLLPYFILIMIALLSACGPKAKNSSTSSASLSQFIGGKKYKVDTKESRVTWFGSNALSPGSHRGYVYLSKGELIVDKDQLTGGTFEVDMNTIADEKHGSKNGLVTHLKSADFFETEKFPFSTFGITAVAPASDSTINVRGNLTIKGITHEVTFPATAEIKDRVVTATGKLTIDRTRWDVRYNSAKFFSNLADGVISDNIEFDIKIVAREND